MRFSQQDLVATLNSILFVFLPVRAGGDVDDDGGVLHGDDEEDVLVARVELHPQHRRREPEPLETQGRFN